MTESQNKVVFLPKVLSMDRSNIHLLPSKKWKHKKIKDSSDISIYRADFHQCTESLNFVVNSMPDLNWYILFRDAFKIRVQVYKVAKVC